MLQEYRFDLNISKREYYSAQNSNNGLLKFRLPEGDNDVLPEDFTVDGLRVLGPLSESFRPVEYLFFRLLRVDHAAAGAAVVQMAVSGAMLGLILTEALSPGIANVPWGGTVGLRASTTFPGLAAPGVALTVNLAGTALFVLSSAMAAWGAAAHVAWALRVSVGVNAAYGVFLLGISAAGIVVAIMGDNDTAALPQAIWLVAGEVGLLLTTFLIASCYVHVRTNTLFAMAARLADGGDNAESSVPRREFVKILEYLELDDAGGLSRALADLVITSHGPLVVDAFRLLVRTHRSQADLHAALVDTLVLEGDDARELSAAADSLTKALLEVANVMQAYVVERNEIKESDLEGRLVVIRQLDPLVLELLEMIGDSAPPVARKLLQRKRVHRIMLRLLRCLPADYHETSVPICYSALAGLCDGAPDIQAEVVTHMDVLIAHLDAVPVSVSMLLSAVYADNLDLAYSVDESLIDQLCQLAKAELHATYLITLRVLISPCSQTVRRNQNLVTKHMDKHEVAPNLCSGPAARKIRQGHTVATAGARGRGKAFINSYVASLELMSSTMQELNLENKARCRGLSPSLTLTLKDLEADVADRSLPPRARAAVLKFLQEAYIETDGGAPSTFLLHPELCSVMDKMARDLELLEVDSQGSFVSRLGTGERVLLLEVFPEVALSFFSQLPGADLIRNDSPRARVGLRLLEALASLLLSSRHDLTPAAERPLLLLTSLLAQRLDPAQPRLRTLIDTDRLPDVLGGGIPPYSVGTVLAVQCERANELERRIAEEEVKQLDQALDVQSGVAVFAGEFAAVMAAAGSGGGEFERLVQTLVKPTLDLRDCKGSQPVEVDEDAEDGGTQLEFSDMHMEALVNLLGSNHELAAPLRQTGLRLIRNVVEAIPFPEPPSADVADTRDWLRTGVPRMVITLMSSKKCEDETLHECLQIAISILDKGQRRAQAAFYSLMTEGGHNRLLISLREHLVRAEQGLVTYMDTFYRLAGTYATQCDRRGYALSISGLEDLARSDVWCRQLVGAHAGEVLRFLQLLCEGHNREMQEYMRKQGGTSVDLVTFTADFLASVSRCIHPGSVRLASQCIDTLIEFVQNPCYANQRALVDTQLPHLLNLFLHMEEDSTYKFADRARYTTDLEELKTKSVTLLLSLVEKVDDPFIPARILKALEIDRVLESMDMLREQYLDPRDLDADPDDEAAEIADEDLSERGPFKVACSMYMLVMTLQYYQDDNASILGSGAGGQETHSNKFQGVKNLKDLTRLRANCGFIEISRGGRLERCFFQIPSVCRYLSAMSKSNIMRKVDRVNHQDQMLDFVFRGQYTDREFDTLLSMSNIILPEPYKTVLLVLSILQLLVCFVRIIGYYVETAILRVRRLVTRDEEWYRIATELYGGPQYYLLFLRLLVTDGYFLTLILYLASNVFALALQGENPLVFFALMLHLMDMFVLSPSLGNVTRAVSSRSQTLVQTAGLAFIMMYIYSAWGFRLFPESFSFEAAEIAEGNEMDYNVNGARCDTIWKCFFVTVDMGLRKGDIGGALEDIQWRDPIPGQFLEECQSPPGLEYMGCVGQHGEWDVGDYIFWRIIYTSTFFLLINTILMNIIFGVIIDTFGDLREQNENLVEELENKCFVCGLERYKFEMMSIDGNGFEDHVKNDHNMWVYIFFIVHLYCKDVSEHNGFESFVFDKLHEVDDQGVIHNKLTPDVSWFPTNEALVLQKRLSSQPPRALSDRVASISQRTTEFARNAAEQLQAVLTSLQELHEESSEAATEVLLL
ncbi:hypothetical protein T484DRAFT_3262606 [Baffinella frigidus]|nr:hypothetical protein T484DRAFT_3262606 [Cryptophyta sp. CCMP2293]